ncbi:ABC transporter substrate-binding protein [Cohnella abietis]|uniref:Peptide ABC transporter n=1 Tax=Cohnella abietis TaxID=2507935 RepID=A0A3T1CZ80_9BACL|nr:ABC transporter substrate-binding protein [Cohnella abietis]BBI31128.1 peptide ABC transporter [Cohnella abietis]
MVKRMAVLSVLLLTMVSILAGCGDAAKNKEGAVVTETPKSENVKESPKTEESRNGGELIFALAGPVAADSFDPHKSGMAQQYRVIGSIFDRLVAELPDHTIKPWLAESWDASPDGLDYTFKLRKDVTFHDGTPFNAEAVKFNFDRITNPETKSGTSLSWLGTFESSDVIDEYTIHVKLKAPYAPFLGNLAKAPLGIVSPTAVAKYGDQFAQNPVGTGPFKFESLKPNTEYVFARNENYNWAPPYAKHTGPAYVDKLIIKNVEEEATRVGVLQSKQVHAADLIPPQNVVALKSDKNFQVIETEILGSNFSWHFNVERAPFNDVKIRKAVQLGLNIDGIVKSLYLGTYERAWAPLSPSILGYDSSLENTWKPDVALANQQLEELGWVKGSDGYRSKDGKRLKIQVLEMAGNREKRQDIATIIQQQLKEIGVEVVLDVLPVAGYVQNLTDGAYDVAGASLFGGDPDVLRSRYFSKNFGVLGNFSRVFDEQLDGWLQQAYQEQDTAKRVDLYKKIQQYVTTEQTFTIPIYILPYTIGTVKEAHDISFDGTGFPVFYDAWISK